MIELGITRRYMRALFDLSLDEGVTYAKRVLADLHWFESLLVEDSDLQNYLLDPRVSNTAKKKTLTKILPEGLQELTRDFLLWVAERGRSQILLTAASEYEALLQDHQEIAVAEVTSAARLDSETRAELVEKLEKVTGRKVKLVASVDPDLLGGLRIRIGSTLYDGSLKRQLEDMRGELLQTRIPTPEAFDFESIEADGASDESDG